MKNSLPGSAKVSKEAKECVQECVSEFISFIVSLPPPGTISLLLRALVRGLHLDRMLIVRRPRRRINASTRNVKR
jgi:hypothetical protein